MNYYYILNERVDTMPLVDAKCTNCGAPLKVDNSKEAAVCEHCGSAFIVEKAINNYNITNNINANVVNIYGDTSNNDFVIEAGKLIAYKGSSPDVIIPDSVFLIGRTAFCKSTIRSVVFPKSKFEIEESVLEFVNGKTKVETAFYSCANLERIVVPKNLKTIPAHCFFSCKNLQEVIIEAGVEAIGAGAFSDCEKLKTIILPDTLKRIGNSAFSCCSSLESIKIPKNVKVIETRTFDSCSALKNVEIDNGVEVIKELAFIGCHNLKTLHFPASMRQVDKQALLSCDRLETITSDNPNLPTNNISSNYQKHEGGCYIATAVYGSYDCPQVWTLRRFRDNTLAKTWYGRVFIRTYYAISPTLVKWFGKTNWFKGIWKPKLDRLVHHLNSKGVSDEQYNDMNY